MLNWDDENLMAGSTKSPIKSPNKSKSGKQTSIEKISEELEEMPMPSHRGVRKTGKWGDESGKGNRRNSSNLMEQERFHNANKERTTVDSDDDDIPVIPDIDDLPDDTKTFQSAHTGAGIQKSTYKELNSEYMDSQKKQNIGKHGKWNTAFLMKKLFPESQLNIPDEEWSDELLMQTVLLTKT